MSQEILNTLWTGSLGVVILFFLLWIIHIVLRNAGVVDVGWGLGFIILCGLYIGRGEGLTLRNIIYFLMVTLWGLRISFFLLKRLAADKREDRRYQEIRQRWENNLTLKFLFFFELQALLEMILATPFLVVSLNPRPGLAMVELLGVVIWAVALIGETTADQQLQNFKSNAANKGRTCNQGLWYYSRHPNYFSEWLIWVGFFVFALGSPYGWISGISPFLMYYLMRYVSGVPLAEKQALVSRGEEYRRYQESTSVFFPLPKKMRNE